MATIIATPTNRFLELMPEYLAGNKTFQDIVEFKVGEGGWITSTGGVATRTPDPSLEDLDAIENPSRYPSDSVATFTKAPSSLVVTGATLEIECVLDLGEFNDDGFGNFPEIYEIGVYTVDPDNASLRIMAAYGTFAKQTKTPAVSLTNIVKITFGVG